VGILGAQKPISEVHRTGPRPREGWSVLKSGWAVPPREKLPCERIHASTDAMLRAGGWMSGEVFQALCGERPGSGCKGRFDFSDIAKNARSFAVLLRKEITLEVREQRFLSDGTRRYAKRPAHMVSQRRTGR